MAAGGGIELGILGPLAAKRDGEVLPLGGAKQRAVLGRLAVAAGRSVSTDALIEALWPERAPGRPQTAIQGYVSHLRKELGADAIVTEANGYRLDAAHVRLDRDDFEQRLARAPELAPPARAAELATALVLWRGGALAEFTYDAWAEPEIARLEELRVVALEARLDADLACGRGAELVPELEALVHEQRLRERPRGQLMLALYRGGRQADALEVYAATRTILRDELGLEPGPELQALQRSILNQEVEPVARVDVPRRPASTGLVGRDGELERVTDLLVRDGARLVTLTGPGGVGKTSLAREVATAVGDSFPDGVVLVELASVREADHVPAAIAAALHASDAADAIGDRRMLLVLDNLEQVVAAAPALAELASRCPQLAILGTSRERLHLQNEVEVALDPLEPEPATALFVERARALGVAVASDDPDVVELCKRLDGLPLALELAAARTKLFPPSELLARLELGSGPVDAPERHRTLTATIEWSLGLLSDAERDLFEGLPVFAGPFDVDDVEAVLQGDVATLAALVDKSLVARRPGERRGRLALLATVRDIVRPRFEARPEAGELSRRHGDLIATELERENARLTGPEEVEALAEIARWQDDLRAALRFALDARDGDLALRLVAAAGRFWYVRGHLVEGSAWLEDALALASSEPSAIRATACMRAGYLADALEDVPLAQRHYLEALEIRRSLGDRTGECGALNNLGNLALLVGDYAAARRAHESVVDLARELDYLIGLASSLHNLSLSYLAEDEPAQALPLLEESLVLSERLGSAYILANVHTNLGAARVAVGDLDDGARHLAEGARILLELDATKSLSPTLEELAALALARGDADAAAARLGAAEAIRAAIGAGHNRADADRAARTEARARDELGEDAFDLAFESGRSLPLTDAVMLVEQTVTAAAAAPG